MYRKKVQIETPGRAFLDITETIQAVAFESKVSVGLCHLFLKHTSASLLLCENYDPDVRRDLEMFTASWVQDGDSRFIHRLEGPDDMAAHIRTVFSHSDLTIPVENGQLDLGTWQGIFLWEHRTHSHQRTITVSVF